MTQLLPPTFRDKLTGTERPLIGMWLCSGSPVMAEIVAGSGLDWVLIDAEHSPPSLAAMQTAMQAMAAYPITSVVRMPSADPVTLKQMLDVGPQNIIVPMISTAKEAEEVVRASRYAPRGVRGVGSAIARSGRWGRVPDYLTDTDKYVSIFVQIESEEGVENAEAIASVDGIDGVFVGPLDLSATLGVIGELDNPEVVDRVERTFKAVKAAGKFVGVNAFDPKEAAHYIEKGADFVIVGADVTLVARGSEKLAQDYGL